MGDGGLSRRISCPQSKRWRGDWREAQFGPQDRESRGQASIEYLIILSFTMVMLLPLIYLFYSQSGSFETQVNDAQAERVVQKIIDAADTVYYLGEPSQQSVTVLFPSGILNSTVSGSSVSLLIQGDDGHYEVVRWSVANLTGNLTTFAGVHRITLTARQGVVVVGG